MQATAIGTSHAKIILIGEHSVVYGQPAIALPLPAVTTQVTLRQQTSGQVISSRYFDGPVAALTSHLRGIQQLILQLLARFDAHEMPFSLDIQSAVPAERGMGSSAAVAVAVTRAFYAFFDRSLTRDDLLATANIEETVTHGTPSGIDAATTSATAPIWFVSHRENFELPFRLQGSLVIADSGIKGQTGEAVSRVARLMATDYLTANDHIATLGQLATAAQQALAQNQVAALGTIMTAAHQQLQALSVSSPLLDRLVQAAIAAGALGAKLTGGGLGGCLIALCDTPKSADQVAAALTHAGATQTWRQDFSFEGGAK